MIDHYFSKFYDYSPGTSISPNPSSEYGRLHTDKTELAKRGTLSTSGNCEKKGKKENVLDQVARFLFLLDLLDIFQDVAKSELTKIIDCITINANLKCDCSIFIRKFEGTLVLLGPIFIQIYFS